MDSDNNTAARLNFRQQVIIRREAGTIGPANLNEPPAVRRLAVDYFSRYPQDVPPFNLNLPSAES